MTRSSRRERPGWQRRALRRPEWIRLEERIVPVASQVWTPTMQLAQWGFDLGRALSPELQALVMPARQAEGAPVAGMPRTAMLQDDQGRVGVRISGGHVEAVAPAIPALGGWVSGMRADLFLLEGFMPVEQLEALETIAANHRSGITAIARPQVGTGSILSQADFLMEADRARLGMAGGLNGAGVTVGVLSDSYNILGGEAAGIASGNLPPNVNVIQEGPAGSSDEGRAMIELVHDLAPGAGLAFASAFYGELAFGNAIRNLADPAIGNARVITDDVFYFEEPLYQDGIIAQAIDEVTANRDVAYFSLAGNLARNAWETTNASFGRDPVYNTGPEYLDFNPGSGVDTRQRITLQPNQTFRITLQWDQPFYLPSEVRSHIGLFLIDPTRNRWDEIVAFSHRNNPVLGIPSQYLEFTNPTNTAKAYDLLVYRESGVFPQQLKWVNYGANNFGELFVNEYATNSPTVIPHSAANGALSVGAVNFFDQSNPASFTSAGPMRVVFSPNGQRLAHPVIRSAPDVAAIQGSDTSFFGNDFDGNGGFNFFGTSAAAPHAAAIGALLRQAEPGLTASQVHQRLITTAIDVGSLGIDDLTGAGLVNAWNALAGPVQAASLPLTENFESGFLSPAWQTRTTGSAAVRVRSDLGSSHHLILDQTLPTHFAHAGLAEATLRVDARGPDPVILSFHQREFNDTDHPMPATFTHSVNADGVAFSVDGVNWHRLVSLTGTSSTQLFQLFEFNLTHIAADLNLTLTADTRIRFQQYGNGQAPNHGMAFDEVRVRRETPASPPTATLGSAPNVGVAQTGAGVYQFTLVYDDAQGINTATLDDSDVTVLGPVGLIAATFQGYTIGSGHQLVATYAFTPPGGGWNAADNGTYVITLNGGQVANLAGLFAPAGTLGEFQVEIAQGTIHEVQIDDGSGQRSMIRSLELTLNGNFVGGLASIPAAAFQLVRVGGGPSGQVAVRVAGVVFDAATGTSRVTLDFLDTGDLATVAGPLRSLADGRYELTISGSLILDAGGDALDADGSGEPGGRRVDQFHRFFGDLDGDGDVDAADYATARRFLLGGPSFYNPLLDANGSGAHDPFDLNTFLANFRRRRL